MAEPYGLEIIEAAQERCASNEIVRNAEISLPAGCEHHRRKMSASGAAAYMNTRRIAAEIARVRVYPSDRRAALANDFGERDERGKRVSPLPRTRPRSRSETAFTSAAEMFHHPPSFLIAGDHGNL